MYDIFHYLALDGTDPFEEWLDGLSEVVLTARIIARIDRIRAGNFGDCKPVGQGVWELRIDFGPGYRVYYAKADQRIVLLLCGGDKRRQAADIRRAIDYWKDFAKREPKP